MKFQYWFIGAVLVLLHFSSTAFSQEEVPERWYKIDQAYGKKEIGSLVRVREDYKFKFTDDSTLFSEIGDSLGIENFLDSVALIPQSDTTLADFYFYSQARTFGPLSVKIREVTTFISQSGDTLYYTNEKGDVQMYIPTAGSGSSTVEWDSILNIPAGFADGVDNVDDADADPTNEIQVLSINGDTIFLSLNGGELVLPFFSGDWNDLLNIPATFPPDPHTHVEADITDLQHYTDADIDGTEAAFNGWDKNESDDFSGNFTDLDFTGTSGFDDLTDDVGTDGGATHWDSLTNVPAGFGDGVDNVDDADNDPTNELYDDQELRDSLTALRNDIDSIFATIDTCCPAPVPTAFAPTDITNLELWLDGADIDGDGNEEGASEAGLSGTEVTAWVDKSGNARDFSSDAGSPQHQQISGTLYSVAFDGDDWMESNHLPSEWTFFHSDDVTVFIRYEINNTSSTNIEYVLSTTLNVTTVGQQLGFSDHTTLGHGLVGFNYNGTGSGSGRYLYHISGGASDFNVDNQFYNTMYFVDHTAATSPERMVCELDGVSLSNSLDNSTGAASANNPDYTMHIGINGPETGGNLSGSVAEIIIYSRELTSGEISDINNYLNSKY